MVKVDTLQRISVCLLLLIIVGCSSVTVRAPSLRMAERLCIKHEGVVEITVQTSGDEYVKCRDFSEHLINVYSEEPEKYGY